MAFPERNVPTGYGSRTDTAEIDQGLRSYMLKVYNYMTIGLAVTGIVALFVSSLATTLDPAAAFQQYADQRTADYEINSVSLLPGELCAYSGQELMGVLADDPAQTIDYADRIIHVWTNNGDYLIAVQLQGPAKSADLDAAKSVLLADFGIRMG